jgi:hypothetical protein
LAFRGAGGRVDAVCPSDHPLLAACATERIYPYRALAPLRSFRAAILSSRPDLVVPCDELAFRYLHRLHEISLGSAGADSIFVRDLVEFSLGPPESYPILESRTRFLSLVNSLGVRVPETEAVSSEFEVEAWLGNYGFPAVLKADGTSGGEGVKVVHNLDEALRAYRMLRGPIPALVVAKRICMDRDWNDAAPWMAQRERDVSIQSFVSGPDANLAVAAWKGEILACIGVEVLEISKSKGPSTVVRLLENEEMIRAAKAIVRRLKFSGLCGFDFMLEKRSGAAYLIEMNARATQTCSLSLGPGRNPVSSIYSAVSGEPSSIEDVEPQSDTIALFPGAWHGNTESRAFQDAYHDIPWETPELIRLGLADMRNPNREKWIRLFTKMRLYQS